MGISPNEFNTVRGLAGSGELRAILERAGIKYELINSIVDRCMR